ncbi:hypothetical protein TSUD_193030 [Trifolium subterraneum]|uniref:non-specific serine/threonine protein kinase n=1 Tax=Trifolium subterraneum TaxID=3900 RepID=A0A2Z6NWB5_TRISU|nr:hypothetical protein TSUD_193030 [Trifolium subterraneum]
MGNCFGSKVDDPFSSHPNSDVTKVPLRNSQLLHGHSDGEGTRVLPWATRIKVATGAARGLTFLHDSNQQIIYRDFKASNILIDSEFNAKLSDFGLAKAGPTGDRSHVSTQVLGTHGYAAPEYILTG